ncbi:hypothetical protein LFZ56_13165 [Salmonella bongori serovar 66:z41:- str. SA19983605]|uniref:Uncharacterized protein n=1 Tax=Salmonella bongori serovar 66:z41:- str. SA19983605 TaxID=1243617 RepID=A0A248KA74_SALBN|nr:hypothetical protein N643_04600 [Salmonella bongori serovar 48:z41:-- str. RKS3044]ASG55153.1 hypothetical protein LFZ56_13165 [Salmonella bongori serovar 66:z41:- str. SA19983605]
MENLLTRFLNNQGFLMKEEDPAEPQDGFQNNPGCVSYQVILRLRQYYYLNNLMIEAYQVNQEAFSSRFLSN